MTELGNPIKYLYRVYTHPTICYWCLDVCDGQDIKAAMVQGPKEQAVFYEKAICFRCLKSLIWRYEHKIVSDDQIIRAANYHFTVIMGLRDCYVAWSQAIGSTDMTPVSAAIACAEHWLAEPIIKQVDPSLRIDMQMNNPYLIGRNIHYPLISFTTGIEPVYSFSALLDLAR